MAQTFFNLGPNAGYIPNLSTTQEIQANLVISYGRDPKALLLNQYCNIVPVKTKLGQYVQVGAGQAWKANYGAYPTGNNVSIGALWAPGQARPHGDFNQISVSYPVYECLRYTFPSTLDLTTVEQSAFNIQTQTAWMLASQAAVNRVALTARVSTNTANYPSTHYGTATAIVGGYLNAGTTTNRLIEKAFSYAVLTILKDTGGTVTELGQLYAVMNPTTAAALAASEEMAVYLAQQQNSISFLKGEDPTSSTDYNLPNKLYGAKLLIDKTVVNTSVNQGPGNLTGYNQFVFPDGVILFCVRPGGGAQWGDGSENPSTISLFEFEGFNVETETDNWNRAIKMAVTDDIDVRVSAPLSGFLITSAISGT